MKEKRKISISIGTDTHEFTFKNVPDYIPNRMLYQMITKDLDGGYAQ